MAHRLPLKDIEFIAEFVAYARKRGDETYDYAANRNCACVQFMRDTGRAVDPSVAGDEWAERTRPEWWNHRQPLPAGIDDRALSVEPWTFPALADRLEALLVDAPMVSQ